MPLAAAVPPLPSPLLRTQRRDHHQDGGAAAARRRAHSTTSRCCCCCTQCWLLACEKYEQCAAAASYTLGCLSSTVCYALVTTPRFSSLFDIRFKKHTECMY
jgi:hypothetical protein